MHFVFRLSPTPLYNQQVQHYPILVLVYNDLGGSPTYYIYFPSAA